MGSKIYLFFGLSVSIPSMQDEFEWKNWQKYVRKINVCTTSCTKKNRGFRKNEVDEKKSENKDKSWTEFCVGNCMDVDLEVTHYLSGVKRRILTVM